MKKKKKSQIGYRVAAGVMDVFGVAAAYLWTNIPLSGSDDEKGKGGSHA